MSVAGIILTCAFFRDVSPWLPFTWGVKGIRASMFGAYGSEWLSSLGVAPEEHRPAMDI